MNLSNVSLLNSLSLMAMCLWGYFDVSSPTALIPFGFGALLFLCFLISSKKPALNKTVVHVSVILTLMILLALVGMRLPKSLVAGGLGLVRVLFMIATSCFSMLFFVKSFIRARK